MSVQNLFSTIFFFLPVHTEVNYVFNFKSMVLGYGFVFYLFLD